MAADWFACLAVDELADFGEEESEVVVDFGRRGDCGSLARGDGVLAESDGRGKIVDAVGIGSVDPLEELSGVW